MKTDNNEDYSDLSYSDFPPSWKYCFLPDCPRQSECMRHLSATLLPAERTWGAAVYPTALSAAACPHFKAIRKIRAAWGFNTLFKNVKRVDDSPLRNAMKIYLGSHSTYYRYHNGKLLLSPEQQEWILNLFRSYGYTEGLAFDNYKDGYDLV